MRIIEAGASHQHYWGSLWAKRSLLFYLTRKDLIVRYKQTVVGVSWVLIRPFLTMMVFTLIFGSIAKLDSNGLPYGFVVFAGVVPWFLFANLLAETSGCMINNGGIMKKLNCPEIDFSYGYFVSWARRLCHVSFASDRHDVLVSHLSELANCLFSLFYSDDCCYCNWSWFNCCNT
jgi:ABC-type polysaccharide/polyol phosphate export permease